MGTPGVLQGGVGCGRGRGACRGSQSSWGPDGTPGALLELKTGRGGGFTENEDPERQRLAMGHCSCQTWINPRGGPK